MRINFNDLSISDIKYLEYLTNNRLIAMLISQKIKKLGNSITKQSFDRMYRCLTIEDRFNLDVKDYECICKIVLAGQSLSVNRIEHVGTNLFIYCNELDHLDNNVIVNLDFDGCIGELTREEWQQADLMQFDEADQETICKALQTCNVNFFVGD